MIDNPQHRFDCGAELHARTMIIRAIGNRRATRIVFQLAGAAVRLAEHGNAVRDQDAVDRLRPRQRNLPHDLQPRGATVRAASPKSEW